MFGSWKFSGKIQGKENKEEKSKERKKWRKIKKKFKINELFSCTTNSFYLFFLSYVEIKKLKNA